MIYSNHGGIIPINESWFKKNKNHNNYKSNINHPSSNIDDFYTLEEENEIVDKAIEYIKAHWVKIKSFINKELSSNNIYKKYIRVENNISKDIFAYRDIYKGRIKSDLPIINTLKDNPDIKYHAKDISNNEALAMNFIEELCKKLNEFAKSNDINIIFEDDADSDGAFIHLSIKLNILDLSFSLK